MSDFLNERLAMLSALIEGDVPVAYKLATELLDDGVPFDALMAAVFAPVQAELGQRWADGDLGIAEEHAASAAVDELVIRLGATAEAAAGPAVVVTTAEGDSHALGARIVATALSLADFRVTFLGASLPAPSLQDYLQLHRPAAVALGCSLPAALAGAARSVAAAHAEGIPVLAGGPAVPTPQRAARLGADAHAGAPAEAVDRLRAWASSPPVSFPEGPASGPEAARLSDRGPALVAGAVERLPEGAGARTPLADELRNVLLVLEGALLLDEPEILAEHLGWLRATGPVHGVDLAHLEAVLHALADAAAHDVPRAGAVLRAALR
jgi:methanogenic corrinoid protein MtbC1